MLRSSLIFFNRPLPSLPPSVCPSVSSLLTLVGGFATVYVFCYLFLFCIIHLLDFFTNLYNHNQFPCPSVLLPVTHSTWLRTYHTFSWLVILQMPQYIQGFHLILCFFHEMSFFWTLRVTDLSSSGPARRTNAHSKGNAAYRPSVH